MKYLGTPIINRNKQEKPDNIYEMSIKNSGFKAEMVRISRMVCKNTSKSNCDKDCPDYYMYDLLS
jgi:hypothetical protein